MNQSTRQAFERAQSIYVSQLPQVRRKMDGMEKICPVPLQNGTKWNGTTMRHIVFLGVNKDILDKTFAPFTPVDLPTENAKNGCFHNLVHNLIFSSKF